MAEPSTIDDIIEAIGLEAAQELIDARGGTEISVPVRAEGSLMASIIGVHSTHRMIRQFGHGRITLPIAGVRGVVAEMAARRDRAKEMLAKGGTERTVALACGLHIRTVRRYRRQMRQPTAQLSLPFDRD